MRRTGAATLLPGATDIAQFNGTGLNVGDVVQINSAETIQQLLLSIPNATFGGAGSLILGSASVYGTAGSPSINIPLTTGVF